MPVASLLQRPLIAQTDPPDSTQPVIVPPSPQDNRMVPIPGETEEQTKARLSHDPQLGVRQMSLAEDDLDALFDRPVRVTLHLSPGHVNTILYDESAPTDAEDGNLIDTRAATIVSSGELETVIEVTPEHLGSLKVSLDVIYDDNSSAEGEVTLKVSPVPGEAKRLSLYRGGDGMTLRIGSSGGLAESRLLPQVQFGVNPRWVSIPDLSQLQNLKVIQDEKNPVIEMDETGLVKPLAPGTALITADFEGISSELHVIVHPEE
jgi:hypothetical protein